MVRLPPNLRRKTRQAPDMLADLQEQSSSPSLHLTYSTTIRVATPEIASYSTHTLLLTSLVESQHCTILSDFQVSSHATLYQTPIIMTDKLPPPLLALFQPRPPIRYIPPQDNAPDTRASRPSQIGGLASFLGQLAESKANDDFEPTESWLQRRDRIRMEKREKLAEMQSDGFKGFKPDEDPKVKGDAFKTLFVGRLAYDVKESDLEREFGRFGPIERIRIVRDEHVDKPKKQSRGYAFIVFEREKDLKGIHHSFTPPLLTLNLLDLG